MNKIFLFFLLIAVSFTACKKDDKNFFSQSPDERINASLAKFQSALTGAPNGWKGYITVDSGYGGTYTFFIKFNDSNRVTMVSDFDSATAVTPNQSSYRLRAQQQPTLIFDTYSYLHLLSDPNEQTPTIQADVNFSHGGQIGSGLLSDFEFILEDKNFHADSIRLTGKVNGAQLLLLKASADEENIFLSGGWKILSTYLNKKLLTYYQRLVINGQPYDIKDYGNEKIMVVSSASGDVQASYYDNTLTGIQFYEPIELGGQQVDNIKLESYDEGTKTINVSMSGTAATINETILPLQVDLDAANRWWQFAFDQDGFWASDQGFHVNGTDDAFHIRSLERFYFLAYYPQFDPGSNDLFGPLFINAAGTALEPLNYYAAPDKPTVGADGIARFTLLGNVGIYPSTGPARLTRDQLFIPEGYYFVQTGETTYDMVSAADGKAWITWYF